VSLAACAKPAPALDDAAVTAKATAAIGPFKSGLKAELQGALARGPDQAIEVCASRAPVLAAEHSTADVRVGRSAKKLRSAANAPPAWLGPVMDDLAKLPSGSTEHRVVRLPSGGYGYAEPIWVQKPCLQCHGENLAPSVDATLRAKYPADAARGFREGDFRGVFYAEITR
jgi:hypothetical protein